MIGLGRIGKEVAVRMKSFGMQVWYKFVIFMESTCVFVEMNLSPYLFLLKLTLSKSSSNDFFAFFFFLEKIDLFIDFR